MCRKLSNAFHQFIYIIHQLRQRSDYYFDIYLIAFSIFGIYYKTNIAICAKIVKSWKPSVNILFNFVHVLSLRGILPRGRQSILFFIFLVQDWEKRHLVPSVCPRGPFAWQPWLSGIAFLFNLEMAFIYLTYTVITLVQKTSLRLKCVVRCSRVAGYGLPYEPACTDSIHISAIHYSRLFSSVCPLATVCEMIYKP